MSETDRPTEHSTLDELEQQALEQEQGRISLGAPAPLPSLEALPAEAAFEPLAAALQAHLASSTMEAAGSDEQLQQVVRMLSALAEDEALHTLSASSLEPLLRLFDEATPTSTPPRRATTALLEDLMRFSQRMPVRQEEPSEAGGLGGDLPHQTASSRMPLPPSTSASARDLLERLLKLAEQRSAEPEPGSCRRGSTMDGLLNISIDAPSPQQEARAAQLGSTMASVDQLAPFGPMRLGPDGRRLFRSRNTDLSELTEGPMLCRTWLPRRQPQGQPPEVDGLNLIPPSTVLVCGERAPSQTCPRKRSRPEPVGEITRERLEYRYGTFERLEIHRPLYMCPECPEVEAFVGALPAYFCREAPLGDGLLAQLIVTRYVDQLTVAQFSQVLARLKAPIPSRVLIAQLSAAAAAAAPVVAHMAEQLGPGAETEPSISTVHVRPGRDEHGRLTVRSGSGHVVVSYSTQAEEEAIGVPGEHTTIRRLYEAERGRGRGARWAQIRRRFFIALPTDPLQARRGLHLLHQLPPLPDDPHAEATVRLKRWLDGCRAEFDKPGTPFAHAVDQAVTLWPLLFTEPGGRHQPHSQSIQWPFEAAEGSPEMSAILLSLTESCAYNGAHPWEYLRALFGALAKNPGLDPRKWTPSAWLGA